MTVVNLGIDISSPALAERKSSTAGLDVGEAELDGGEAERQRRLESSTLHEQRLQRRPETSRARRLGFAELQTIPRERGR
jgi:hypothetical protein